LQWPPGALSIYQICSTDTCTVDPATWLGASRLVVAAHVANTHELVRPIVQDSVALP
jgi:hypothetical protein